MIEYIVVHKAVLSWKVERKTTIFMRVYNFYKKSKNVQDILRMLKLNIIFTNSEIFTISDFICASF